MFQKFIKNLEKLFLPQEERCQFANQNCQGKVNNYQLTFSNGSKKKFAWTACSAHQQVISQQFSQQGYRLIEREETIDLTKNHDPKK